MSEQKAQEVIPQSKSLNPFEGDRAAPAVSSAGNSEMHRSVAEVQAAIMLAKQFPRSKIDSVDRILTECCRPTLAEAAIFSYPKGGQEVTGASIRLAEVLAMNWGNFTFGWKQTGRHIGADGVGVSEIQSYAWDYETNVRTTREFTVRHWRDTKKGGYPIKDERDIYELCANQAARRMRACVVNCIPGDVLEAAVKKCETTMATNEVVTPDKIKEMIKAFEAWGVTKEHIEKRIGRKIDAINGATMVQLRKIYNGLKEGMSRPSEFFDVPEEAANAAKPASNISSLIDVPEDKKAEPEKKAEPTTDKLAVIAECLKTGIMESATAAALESYLKEQEADFVDMEKAKRMDLLEMLEKAAIEKRKTLQKAA